MSIVSSSSHTPTLGSRIGALTLVRVIGKGASAVVYHSRSETGDQYAVKAIRMTGQTHPKRHKNALKEISVHTLVSSHPNIVSILDVFTDRSGSDDDPWPHYTYLVLPFSRSGDLYSLILDQKLYLNNSMLIRSIFLQLLSAVQHCHSLGVFHRDIKSENILAFDGGRKVMLADFGLATTQTRSQEWVIGTVPYMSPECLGGPYAPEEGYSPAANDVWSLGVLLINLLTGRNPWRKATSDDDIFVEYCLNPCGYLLRALPISWQANAILQCMFVAEDQRPDVLALMASVAATREWYDVDAVFDGCMARWREPEDYVGRDGWVCRGPPDEDTCSHFSDDLAEASFKEALDDFGTARPANLPPPPLVIRNRPAESRSDSYTSSPPLSSTSSMSTTLPETPLNTRFSEVRAPLNLVLAEVSHLEIQDDPFRWIGEVADAVKSHLPNRPSRPLQAVAAGMARTHSRP